MPYRDRSINVISYVRMSEIHISTHVLSREAGLNSRLLYVRIAQTNMTITQKCEVVTFSGMNCSKLQELNNEWKSFEFS